MSGKTNHPAGSWTANEPAFFVAGLIRRPHGVKGELQVDVDKHYLVNVQAGKFLFVGETHEKMRILSSRRNNSGFLIKLEGLETPEQAGNYRLKNIYVSSQQRSSLAAGNYYPDQLLNLAVKDIDTGEELGWVSEIIETGANDVYVVSSENSRDLLLPAIKDVVKGIDIDKGEILVHMLPGLNEVE